MGGVRWDSVRTLHEKGNVKVGDLQGTYEAWLDLGSLHSYTELRLGDIRSVSGWNGSVAWSADQTGDVCIMSGEAATHSAADNAYQESFGYLRSQPAVAAKGRSLLISPPGLSPFELWTDPSTNRVARIVPVKGVDRDATAYSDFRLVDGLVLPFRITEHDTALTLTSIELDRDPPPHLFDPPEAVLSGLQFPPGNESVTIPFRYHDEHIYLPVSINGRPFQNFAFDTGMNNIIDAARAKSIGLKVVKFGTAYGGGTGSAPNGITKVDRLEVGGLKMENQIVDAVPLPGVDGGIGYELVKRSVVTIDYSLRQITVTRPEAFRPPIGATRLPLRFSSTAEVMVDATVEGIAGEFQLDTGQGLSLIINRPFAEQNGLLAKYGSGRKASVSGIGGKAGTVIFAPAQFAIGALTPQIAAAQIMLSKTGGGAEEYVAGTIGNQLLRQYKVTLDYGHGAIYLEPDPAYRDDRDWTSSSQASPLGFTRLARRSAGPIEILGVATKGPASRAGVKKGDSILAINGVPVADLTREKLFSQIFAPDATAVKLTILRNGITREVTLVK